MSTTQLESRLNLERSILKIELKSVSAGFMVDLSLLRTETVTEMDQTRDDPQCHCRSSGFRIITSIWLLFTGSARD